MPQADPSDQLRLLDLAATDKAVAGAEHRRSTLPEIAVISAGSPRLTALRSTRVLAATEVSDLDREATKLDAEIDQVRLRRTRNDDRLASGAGPAKDLTSLQHEIESLERRQGVLEDQSLELMEKREEADAALAEATGAHDVLAAELQAAQTRRDDQFADLDHELQRLRATRADQFGSLPADLTTLYERIHRNGRVAAARLVGGQCQACRLTLDSVALQEIRTADPAEVMRCTECGAILVRT